MVELATVLAFMMGAVSLAGGVIIIVVGIQQHTKKLEMRHRERLAMIERGLAPGPEKDPAAFNGWQRRRAQPPGRSTSIGVVAIALGIGLMLMIGVAGGAGEAAIGVGGSIVVLGIAFIIIGELQRRSQPAAPSSFGGPPPDWPPPPPRPFGSSEPPRPAGP
jgi:hypothetical protein